MAVKEKTELTLMKKRGITELLNLFKTLSKPFKKKGTFAPSFFLRRKIFDSPIKNDSPQKSSGNTIIQTPPLSIIILITKKPHTIKINGI